MNRPRSNVRHSILVLTLISILLMTYRSSVFAYQDMNTVTIDQTSSVTNEVWKYTENDVEIYLMVNENEDDTLNLSMTNQGNYLYFFQLDRIGTSYQLLNTHWCFPDIELNIEIEQNSIILNAVSDKLKIDFRNAVFLRTPKYPLPVKLVAELKDGSDWFLSQEFIKRIERGKKIYKEVSVDSKLLSVLSEEDQQDYDLYFKYISSYPWETQGEGCSWYCGVQDYNTDSSSALESIGNIEYSSLNVHDYSLLTAWVEGEQGDGIGESVTISFPSGNPRATQIQLYNGYQKSKETYYNNGRVKVLTLFINNIEYGVLHIEDTPRVQVFNIDLTSVLNSDNDLQFRFRIDEDYEGELYQDTAISEINFSGVDVH